MQAVQECLSDEVCAELKVSKGGSLPLAVAQRGTLRKAVIYQDVEVMHYARTPGQPLCVHE